MRQLSDLGIYRSVASCLNARGHMLGSRSMGGSDQSEGGAAMAVSSSAYPGHRTSMDDNQSKWRCRCQIVFGITLLKYAIMSHYEPGRGTKLLFLMVDDALSTSGGVPVDYGVPWHLALMPSRPPSDCQLYLSRSILTQVDVDPEDPSLPLDAEPPKGERIHPWAPNQLSELERQEILFQRSWVAYIWARAALAGIEPSVSLTPSTPWSGTLGGHPSPTPPLEISLTKSASMECIHMQTYTHPQTLSI